MSDLTRRTVLAGALAACASYPAYGQITRLKSARIIVCLADNENQGIVPTTAQLGNGQDPRNNLYWGALYGVKSYFSRQKETWPGKTATESEVNMSLQRRVGILDEAVFISPPSPSRNEFRIVSAEAWDGRYMKQAIQAFYESLAQSDSSPDLTIFVGHNGLMDFPLFAPVPSAEVKARNLERKRAAMVFACNSADYFTDTIRNYGVNPAVMTHGLMAPEAYAIEPAVRAWFDGKNNMNIRRAAAAGYAKYQKIPVRNARRLFGI